MNEFSPIRQLRHRSQLSLRALASLADTSYSTLSSYEHGRVSPTLKTLNRIARSANLTIEPTITVRVTAMSGLDRGEELEQALHLAEEFPARRSRTLGPQRFPFQ